MIDRVLNIIVDLDGTLIYSDTLYESFLLLIKHNPAFIFLSLFWLLKGKAFFKAQISKRINLNPVALPYNTQLIAKLKEFRRLGAHLYLVTAANEKIAHAIAQHLDLFDEVIASTETTNMNSKNKAVICNQRFGEKQYLYAGNHSTDLNVWQHAAEAIIVSSNNQLINKAKKITSIRAVIAPPQPTLKTYLKQLRVHQYVKNGLLFIPLLLSIPVNNYLKAGLFTNILAFICFSSLASATYIINDLMDLTADRLHSSKCTRPLASAYISIPQAIVLTIILFVISIVITLFLPVRFSLTLFVYLIITLGYSFYFKRKTLLDVFVLAGLYMTRIFAGMMLIANGFSQWLLMFSLFFFASLAFIKRYVELAKQKQKGSLTAHGRGYHINHLDLIRTYGIASAYVSGLIFALYISSDKVKAFYSQPNFLYAMIVLIIYWLSRVWLKAEDGKVHDDPIVFAIKDKVTWMMVAFFIIIYTLASLPKGII
ncbi:MAG: UbiA family prenyltransferase [Pseudomonadota bacterium]